MYLLRIPGTPAARHVGGIGSLAQRNRASGFHFTIRRRERHSASRSRALLEWRVRDACAGISFGSCTLLDYKPGTGAVVIHAGETMAPKGAPSQGQRRMKVGERVNIILCQQR